MDERSIAEIIGWQIAPTPSVHGIHFQPPAVDDLLAWLLTKVNTVETLTGYADLGSHVRWWPGDDSDEGVYAPTLLGALEAAVRTVDATTPSPKSA